MTTPISMFMSGPKKANNHALAKPLKQVIKHGMDIQFDFGSEKGGVTPGYTSSH